MNILTPIHHSIINPNSLCLEKFSLIHWWWVAVPSRLQPSLHEGEGRLTIPRSRQFTSLRKFQKFTRYTKPLLKVWKQWALLRGSKEATLPEGDSLTGGTPSSHAESSGMRLSWASPRLEWACQWHSCLWVVPALVQNICVMIQRCVAFVCVGRIFA